jgi:deoxycytidylate deaminase
MNNHEIIQSLIKKIVAIEQENMESADAENNEIRGRIVNSILSELDKAVTDDEN